MDEEQLKRFIAATEHPYSCDCELCREWWLLVGPEPED